MNKIFRNILLIISIFAIFGCGSESSYSSSTISEETIVDDSLNHRPIANANGDKYFVLNNRVDLNGSLSTDEDGDSLNCSWNISSKPSESLAELSDSSSCNSSFIADKDGEFIVELVVNDGTINSLADTISIKKAKIKNPDDFAIPTLEEG